MTREKSSPSSTTNWRAWWWWWGCRGRHQWRLWSCCSTCCRHTTSPTTSWLGDDCIKAEKFPLTFSLYPVTMRGGGLVGVFRPSLPINSHRLWHCSHYSRNVVAFCAQLEWQSDSNAKCGNVARLFYAEIRQKVQSRYIIVVFSGACTINVAIGSGVGVPQ